MSNAQSPIDIPLDVAKLHAQHMATIRDLVTRASRNRVKLDTPLNNADIATEPKGYSPQQINGSIQPTLATLQGFDGSNTRLLRSNRSGGLQTIDIDYSRVIKYNITNLTTAYNYDPGFRWDYLCWFSTINLYYAKCLDNSGGTVVEVLPDVVSSFYDGTSNQYITQGHIWGGWQKVDFGVIVEYGSINIWVSSYQLSE